MKKVDPHHANMLLKSLEKEIRSRGHKDDPTILLMLHLFRLQQRQINEIIQKMEENGWNQK